MSTAIIHTAPHHCELQSSEQQPAVGAEVAGPTIASLVSPGTELNTAYCHNNGRPRGSGYAAVFRVEQAGPEAEGVQIGDLVFTDGSHRSWQCRPTDQVFRLPAGLDPATATLARLMGVSHSTLLTTQARAGDRVLITGLGPVGILAALQFRHCGYEVHGCDIDPLRCRIAESAGIPSSERPPDDFAAALAIECSGHEKGLLASIDGLSKGGEIVLVGVPWKQQTDDAAHAISHAIFHRYIHMRSGWEWMLPREKQHFSQHHSIRQARETCLRWLAEGHIPLPRGMLGRCDPADCNAIYTAHLHRAVNHLCSVFMWSE